MSSSSNTSEDIVYFMFSSEQLKLRRKVEEKMNKRFSPGTVIVGGQRKYYTEILRDPTKTRYKDARIVTSGDINKINYTEPVSE